jgi:glycosyltransferase involved in cell wall biosynthesis
MTAAATRDIIQNGDEELPASPGEGSTYAGVGVRYLPLAFPRRFFGARLASELRTALRRADLCHVHGIWNVPEWIATRAARAHGTPYVLSPRGMLQPGAMRHGWWRKKLALGLVERTSLGAADLLHATSEAEAEVLRALTGSPRIVVVPNGVDLAATNAAADRLRRRLSIPGDAFVIVFLGRIHPIKRLDLLVEAFADVRCTHPAAHLVVAGPDERGLLADTLRPIASHAPFVHAVGAVNEQEKWSLLRDADVLVQCSDSESFGLAAVEAMAAGVPVILTRTCPWPDIEKRGCGLWVNQTPGAIAHAIRRLAGDRALAKEIGVRGAAYAREVYSWDAIGCRFADLYAEVLERGRARVA